MEPKSPLEKFTTKTERFNEFPEKEIGVDYPLPPEIEIEFLAKAVFDDFNDNKNAPYQIARSMPNVVDSKTKYFKYSTKNNGEKIKLFTVSMRDRDGVISIKRKTNKLEKNGVTFQDEVEYQLPDKQWTPELEEKIKLEQAKLFTLSPDKITQTSENIKRKLKVRVENTNTKRIYTIGITVKTKIGGKSKKSLSIDYIGSEIQSTTNKVYAESEVIEDIKNIKEKTLNKIIKTF